MSNSFVNAGEKSGLTFPPKKILSRMRRNKRYGPRIVRSAAIFTTAVLEYICREVLVEAGNSSKANKRTRITPRHIQLAVRNDKDMNKLLGGVVIATGSVLPNIHPVLLPRKTEATTKSNCQKDASTQTDEIVSN